MTSRNRHDVRTAIEGEYLDEVQIRCAKPYLPNCVCYLSFAAYRHWAQVKGERVAVAAQATTIAKLFADAVGGRTAVVEVGGEKIDPCILEAVESGETDGVDDMIVLRLHRSSKAGA